MNVHESEKIAGILREKGYSTPVESEEEADIIVFNTCCIRENAENHAFGNIGNLKKLKKRKKELIVAVGGCMAQEEGKAQLLKEKFPFIDIIFGTHNVAELGALIDALREKRKKQVSVLPERKETEDHITPVRTSYPNAWVNITYGCNNFCTYCIVPYVRGRERSREPAAILAEFRQLVAQGYKEITLLGQNVNSYGKGLENPIDFADLLNLLCEVPGDYQIRFMTSHPKDASRKLIDTIAAQEHLCKHIHLPVQSGSDRLLKEMNRHYDVAQYMDLIHYAKEKIPGVTFSSDIIVGFPGETEEDFEATLELIRKVGYMQLFTFIYSKRTGTKAAELPDPTPRKEKTDRMSRLLKVQDEIAMALVKAQVGQTVKVLVEGFGRNEGTLSGRLDNNLTVEFTADASLMGSYANVHLTGARATVLLGELA